MSKVDPNSPAINVAICTPTAGIVHAAYAMCLPRMMLHFLATPVFGQEDKQRGLNVLCRVGAAIGQNRDDMVDQALEGDSTHILFIDDDMGFMGDTLNILLARQMPIVFCNYRFKAPPCNFMARNKDNSAPIVTRHSSDSLEESFFGGLGFALIERRVFESLGRPRFFPTYDEKTKAYSTEDLPFYKAARAAGFCAFVDHRASKRVWHNGSYAFNYDENISAERAIPTPERDDLRQ